VKGIATKGRAAGQVPQKSPSGGAIGCAPGREHGVQWPRETGEDLRITQGVNRMNDDKEQTEKAEALEGLEIIESSELLKVGSAFHTYNFAAPNGMNQIDEK
jgi:hypothetical protein